MRIVYRSIRRAGQSMPSPAHRPCLQGLAPRALLPPEVFEPLRSQFGVPDRVLNVAVTKVRLQRPRVMAGIGQCEAARVPQHVGMGLEDEAGRPAGTLDKLGETRGGERRAALACEHERRWRCLALQFAQGVFCTRIDRFRRGNPPGNERRLRIAICEPVHTAGLENDASYAS
jgi:hypothetical protein